MTKAGGKEYWKLWPRLDERGIENYDQGWRKGVLKTITKAGGKWYWKLWARLEERSIENYDQGRRKGVLKTVTKAGGKEYWKLWARMEERSNENYDPGWRKGVLQTMTMAGGKEYWNNDFLNFLYLLENVRMQVNWWLNKCCKNWNLIFLFKNKFYWRAVEKNNHVLICKQI